MKTFWKGTLSVKRGKDEGRVVNQRTFRIVGDGSGLADTDMFYREEVVAAARNKSMPLEGLRYPVTPTGMHYILVHYDIPEVDIQGWRLRVEGLVSKSLDLTLNEIKKRPTQTIAVTMECAGNGRALCTPRNVSQPWMTEAIGTARWTGTPLRGILEEAGLNPKAVEVVFTGLDRGIQGGERQYYQRSLGVDEVTRPEVLLAYEMNGEPLEPQHGYPLRLVAPGWYGMASVKWLDRVKAVARPFKGYQMVQSYRYSQTKEELGEPVTLMKVRALMVPPGIPEMSTRTRVVSAGPVTLTGRAWTGRSNVARVEVSVDGGGKWSEAHLGEAVSPYAWSPWTFRWDARPGASTLCVRATDSRGNIQPLDQLWNWGGYGNNMVQRIEVEVE